MNKHSENITSGISQFFQGVLGLTDEALVNITDPFMNREKREIMTFDDLIHYRNQRKTEIPQIAKSVVMITHDPAGHYRVEQVFKNAQGEFIFADEQRKDIYGRILLVQALDEELQSVVQDREKITLEI